MGTPAAVQGDRVTGTCVGHQVPSASGTAPAPPMPFGAPLLTGLATTVLNGGKPAAVDGSGGTCNPPHTGLQDPFMAAPSQRGTVVSGSATVLFEGKPAATASSNCTMCMGPATSLLASASTVLVG